MTPLRRRHMLDELGTLLVQCEHYRRRSALLEKEWDRIYEIYQALTGKSLMRLT